jgi:hypothetical protein
LGKLLPNKVYGFSTYLVIFVLLVAGYLFVPGVTNGVNAIWGALTGAPAAAVTGATGAAYSGNMNIVISQVNELTAGAAAPTTPTYTYFTSMPGMGSVGSAITVTGTVVQVPASANGIVYIEAFSGTDFYNDWEKIKSVNPYVSDVIWTDRDGDGTHECILKLDVSKISPINPAQNPTCTINLPLIADDFALAISSPADQTLGAALTTGTLEWVVSGSTVDNGACFEKIYFVTNATGTGGLIQFKNMRISGGMTQTSMPKKDWNAPTFEEGGTAYTAWYVKGDQDIAISDYNDYYNDVMTWRRTGEADTLTFSVDFECTLSSHVVVTAHVATISAAGALQTELTDAVTLADA